MTRGFGQRVRPPRPRRYVSPGQARVLRFVGFRYDAFREAYVLRVIGKRFGPVLRLEDHREVVVGPRTAAPFKPAAERIRS